MKPGDLICLNNDVIGTQGTYREGDIGIIIGPALDPINRRVGNCWLLHINGTLEEVADHWLDEVKDD